jgi:hypothetical protein
MCIGWSVVFTAFEFRNAQLTMTGAEYKINSERYCWRIRGGVLCALLYIFLP